MNNVKNKLFCIKSCTYRIQSDFRENAPIWQFFANQVKKKIRLFARCGGALSLGSEKPNLQTTTGLRLHLKSKHQTDFVNLRTFLRIFVHSVSVFGLRPDIYPVRYSVLA